MDPVTVLFAVDVLAGILLVAAGIALAHERRPDDPTYRPRHIRPADDGIERALTASHRQLRRRSLAPWAPIPVQATDRPVPSYPPSDETVTKPLGEPVTNLPDVAYKTFWTVVALVLGYLTTVAAPDVGPTWTPFLAAVWTPVLVAARAWVDKRTATQSA